VSGVLLLRVRCAHKQIQPVYNAEPHPIIIRVELVHNALDHLSVRGAPHTPYQALGQRVQFLVAQEGEVFEFFGGVVGFGPLWGGWCAWWWVWRMRGEERPGRGGTTS